MTIQTEKKIKENIQKNLVFYRKKLKITQRQLADYLETGVSTVSGWERGAYTPDIDTLFAICKLFHIGLNDMCGISADNSPLTDDENDLLNTYKILNDAGRQKLLERAVELRDLGVCKRGRRKNGIKYQKNGKVIHIDFHT